MVPDGRSAEDLRLTQRRDDTDPTSPAAVRDDRLSLDIPVTIDGYAVNALLDTGADYSILSGKLATQLKKVITPWHNSQIRTAGGHVVTPLGACATRVHIQGYTFVASCLVLRECSRDVILGVDFLQEHGAIIDLQERRVTFSAERAIDVQDDERRVDVLRVSGDSVTLPPRASVLVDVTCCGLGDGEAVAETNLEHLLKQGICVARSVIQLRGGRSQLLVTNFSNEHRHLFGGTSIAFANEVASVNNCFTSEAVDTADTSLGNIDINPALSSDNHTALRTLLLEFRSCFASCSKVRQTSITRHRIITYEDARPIHQHPYRVSAKEREAIRTQVREMLDDGVIEPSNSPWSSPVVLVKKKDGTLRFCVDYRKLNNVTKKDVYPLPRIDDSLDRLRCAHYFSLDLKSGYWQIEVDERDREKTAFVTPDGLYQFRVLPFGLCSAPATFQRMMDTVLTGLKWQTCLVYLDDVVVFSATFENIFTACGVC